MDTPGLLIQVAVPPADIHAREGVKLLLSPLQELFPRMKKGWADQGYTGTGREGITAHLGGEVEIVRPSWPARGQWVPHGNLSDLSPGWLTYERSKPGPKKFRGVLPRRWVGERTFAWMGRYRRLSKDDESFTSRSESMVCLTMLRLMVRRLTDTSETTRENAQRRRAA